ncbi:hypothetical protein [Pseudomonas sp. Z2-11]
MQDFQMRRARLGGKPRVLSYQYLHCSATFSYRIDILVSKDWPGLRIAFYDEKNRTVSLSVVAVGFSNLLHPWNASSGTATQV